MKQDETRPNDGEVAESSKYVSEDFLKELNISVDPEEIRKQQHE